MTQPHSGLSSPVNQPTHRRQAKSRSSQSYSAAYLQLVAKAIAGQALRQVAAEQGNYPGTEPQESPSVG